MYWPIAQGLEHTSYKRAVPGSNPGGPTIQGRIDTKTLFTTRGETLNGNSSRS